MTVRGSCHCGKIAYSLDADAPTEAISCNCSHCRRKGYLLAFFPAAKFTLETPREAMATYQFNKHVIDHHFCKVCGCAPFAEGKDAKGNDTVSLNLRCMDGFDEAKLKINRFDGASH